MRWDNRVSIIFSVLILACSSAVSVSAYSTGAKDHHITMEQWIDAVAVSGIPSQTLFAMSLVESGTTFKRTRDYAPWPWILNVNQEAMFFSSREAARLALRNFIEDGVEWIAVGMYQIHLKYNSHLVDDPLSLLEPEVNLRAAATVLANCGKIYPSVQEKLACYYSGDTDEAGMKYAQRVMDKGEKWGKPYLMEGNEELKLVEIRRSQLDSEVVSQNNVPVDDIAVKTSQKEIAPMPDFVPDVKPQTDDRYAAFLAHLKRKEQGSATEVSGERAIKVGGE